MIAWTARAVSGSAPRRRRVCFARALGSVVGAVVMYLWSAMSWRRAVRVMMVGL